MITRIARQCGLWLALAGLLMAATGCTSATPSGGEPTAAPESAETAETIVPTPTVEPTATPSPEPSATPTEAATPTETLTPTPVFEGIDRSNASSLVEVRRMNEDHTALTVAAYSPANDLIATFGWSKKVTLFDAATGDLSTVLTGASEWGVAMEFSPDGSKIAAGSGFAYRFWVWDIESQRIIWQAITNSWVRRLRWSPDGSQLAAAGQSNGNLLVYEGDSGNRIAQVGVKGWELSAAAYSPDGKYLAVGDSNGNVVILSAEDFVVVAEAARQTSTVIADMEFSPDSQWLAVVFDASVILFETENWTRVNSFTAHAIEQGGTFDMDFGKASDVLFTCGGDGRFAIWDVEGGANLFTEEFGITVWSVSVSGDGRQVALALDDGTVVVMGLPEN